MLCRYFFSIYNYWYSIVLSLILCSLLILPSHYFTSFHFHAPSPLHFLLHLYSLPFKPPLLFFHLHIHISLLHPFPSSYTPPMCTLLILPPPTQVMGDLATQRPKENSIVSGILVKRNFNCHIISPKDLGSECVHHCCILLVLLSIIFCFFIIFVLVYHIYFLSCFLKDVWSKHTNVFLLFIIIYFFVLFPKAVLLYFLFIHSCLYIYIFMFPKGPRKWQYNNVLYY